MQATHKLSVQHGKWGYFGIVQLDVDLNPNIRGVHIEFAVADPEWRAGVEFGITYAHEKVIGNQPPGANVRVLEARGHIVDSSQVLMAFVAANAFCKAIDVAPPPGLRLDEETGKFIFPK